MPTTETLNGTQMCWVGAEASVSWHCIGSNPRLRFALGIETCGEVSGIVAEA